MRDAGWLGVIFLGPQPSTLNQRQTPQRQGLRANGCLTTGESGITIGNESENGRKVGDQHWAGEKQLASPASLPLASAQTAANQATSLETANLVSRC